MTDSERCVIYLRVSTVRQSEENQFESCKQYAEARDFDVVETVREKKSAYKNGSQEKKSEIMERARKGEFQHIVVWSLDRWTREGAESLMKDLRRMDRWGVELHSVQEEFLDTFNDSNFGQIVREFVTKILAWQAELESIRRGERVREAYERKMQGDSGQNSWGRSKTSFDVSNALKMHANGLGYRKIAEKLDADVSYGTVRNRLKEIEDEEE